MLSQLPVLRKDLQPPMRRASSGSKVVQMTDDACSDCPSPHYPTPVGAGRAGCSVTSTRRHPGVRTAGIIVRTCRSGTGRTFTCWSRPGTPGPRPVLAMIDLQHAMADAPHCPECKHSFNRALSVWPTVLAADLVCQSPSSWPGPPAVERQGNQRTPASSAAGAWPQGASRPSSTQPGHPLHRGCPPSGPSKLLDHGAVSLAAKQQDGPSLFIGCRPPSGHQRPQSLLPLPPAVPCTASPSSNPTP